VLLSTSFPSQACESRTNTKRFSSYIIKDEVFNIACAWNSAKAKKSTLQAWRKLWPTVMTGEGASDEEDFAGFNIRNKNTVHEMASLYEKLSPSIPEREVSQVDVEVWTDGSKGTAM
jgi:hypothetical protein